MKTIYGYDEILDMVGADNIEQLVGSFGRLSAAEIETELSVMFGGDEYNDKAEIAQEIQRMCENHLCGKLVIRNTETNQIIGLELIDPKNGINWVRDYIGNESGFGSLQDGLIEYDQVNDIYLAGAETIEWWTDILEKQRWIDEHLPLLYEKYNEDTADQIIDYASCDDLEGTVNELTRMLRHYLDLD